MFVQLAVLNKNNIDVTKTCLPCNTLLLSQHLHLSESNLISVFREPG